MVKKTAESEFQKEIHRASNNFDKYLLAKSVAYVNAPPTNSSITTVTKKHMNVFKPVNLNEVQNLIDCLIEREGLVVSLENAKNTDAQRILDFLSGAVYAIKGKITLLSEKLYLLTPEGVDIATKV